MGKFNNLALGVAFTAALGIFASPALAQDRRDIRHDRRDIRGRSRIFTVIVWICTKDYQNLRADRTTLRQMLRTEPALVRLPQTVRQSAVRRQTFEAIEGASLTTAETCAATDEILEKICTTETDESHG